MNKRLMAILGAVLLLIAGAWQGIDGVTVRDIGSSAELERPALSASAATESLTQHQKVVKYLQTHHRLPDFYLTKKQAREQGWDAQRGTSVTCYRAKPLAVIVSPTVSVSCLTPKAVIGEKLM